MDYCKFCMAPMGDEKESCPVCGRYQYTETPLHHLAVGTILNGKFLVGESLGEGGFGITYIGRDIRLDLRVAIKEYYPNGYANRSNTVAQTISCGAAGERRDFFEKGRERFLEEAKILAKFEKEDGIVNVRDFFEENNTAYIVMEYLDGETLRDFIERRGCLTPEQTIDLLMPVMKSLKKIHQQGLIHRDISPDNIMLTDDKVKLLDFGAARVATAESNRSLSVVLKPGYAPEEQYRSRGIQGPWTDIYALCATMYKCITGITPDDSNERARDDQLKPPSALGISINPVTESALLKGLSVLQKDRFQSIDELLDGFNGIGFTDENNKNVPENTDSGNDTFIIGMNSGTDDDSDENDTMMLFGGNQKTVAEESETQSITSSTPSTVSGQKKVESINYKENEGKKGSKTLVIGVIAGIAVIAIAVILIIVLGGKDNKGSSSSGKLADSGGQSSAQSQTSSGDEKGSDKADNNTKSGVDKNSSVQDDEEGDAGDDNAITTGNSMLSEVQDSLSDAKEQKKYQFTVNDDGVIWFTYSHDYIDEKVCYWKCSLYNSEDTKMTEIKFTGNETEPVNTRKIGLRAGEYYILQSAGDSYSNGQYNIQVYFDNSTLWEKEFNDIKNISNPIDTNTEVHGSLMANSDVDWYSFKLDTSGKVILDFANMKSDKAKNYWDAYIYDESGSELCLGHFNGNATGFEHTESLSLEPGKYYICVTPGEKYSVHQYYFVVNYSKD